MERLGLVPGAVVLAQCVVRIHKKKGRTAYKKNSHDVMTVNEQFS